jgi:hypothetical protein
MTDSPDKTQLCCCCRRQVIYLKYWAPGLNYVSNLLSVSISVYFYIYKTK